MHARFLAFAVATVMAAASHLNAAQKTVHEYGVSVTFDDALLPNHSVKKVKATPLINASDKPDGVAPAHVLVDFGPEHGEIRVYPTSDPAVKSFARSFPTIDDAHKALVTVLKEKPAESKEMPLMPWADIGVAFNKKIRYLDFRSGSGVAWLAQWGVDVGPINNGELWYVIQGLTKDGAHYVAAQFRVSHPSLPATGEVKDPAAFEKGYQAYLKKALPALVKQTDESFRPSLAALRAIFESIEVGVK